MFIQSLPACQACRFRRPAPAKRNWRSLCLRRRSPMLAQLVIEPVKALLVAAMVFIPFERLAAANRAQRVFRDGWATDAATGLANGLLLYLVLLGSLAGID